MARGTPRNERHAAIAVAKTATKRQAGNERENLKRNAESFPLETKQTIHSNDLSHLYSFGTNRRNAALLHISSFSFLLSFNRRAGATTLDK